MSDDYPILRDFDIPDVFLPAARVLADFYPFLNNSSGADSALVETQLVSLSKYHSSTLRQLSKHKPSFEDDSDAFPGMVLLTLVDHTKDFVVANSSFSLASFRWWPLPAALKQLKDEGYRAFPSGASLEDCLLNFFSSNRPNTPAQNEGTVDLADSDEPSKPPQSAIPSSSAAAPSRVSRPHPVPSPLPKIATLDSPSKPSVSSGSGSKPSITTRKPPPFGPATRPRPVPVSKPAREPILTMRASKPEPRSSHEEELPVPEDEEDSTDAEVHSIPALVPLKTSSSSKPIHPYALAWAKAAPNSSRSGKFRPSAKGSASSSLHQDKDDDNAMAVDSPPHSSSAHLPNPPRRGVSTKQVARVSSRPRLRQPVSTRNSSLTSKAKAIAVRVGKGKEVKAPKSAKMLSKPSMIIPRSHPSSSSRRSSLPEDEEDEEDDEEEEDDEDPDQAPPDEDEDEDELDASGDDDAEFLAKKAASTPPRHRHPQSKASAKAKAHLAPVTKPGGSKRKREASLPDPNAPVTRSRKSEVSRRRKAPSEDPSLVAEDEPPPKKVRRRHPSDDEASVPEEEEDPTTSYAPRRRRIFRAAQGKRTNAKSSQRKERTDFGPIPSPPASFEEVEVKPVDEMDFIDDNPPSLLPSLPGTNHVDSRNLAFWDGPASYGLTRDLGDINNGVHRKLRGTLSVPGQLDIEVHTVTNALAPMILRTPDNFIPCCPECVDDPEGCIPCSHPDGKPSNADEFDQLKVAFATWGESSEAGIGRQMGEIAEGRRVVENLILTRDSLNDQISHLASVDAARVRKLRASCRDPRDMIRILIRNDAGFQWSMPIITQLCAVFDWECSEFSSSLVLERDEAGNCQLRNPSTNVILPIPSDFPSDTPRPSSSKGPSMLPEAEGLSDPDFLAEPEPLVKVAEDEKEADPAAGVSSPVPTACPAPPPSPAVNRASEEGISKP
ncbi:hypothetical protein PQX77_014659 [Marasmius sp. AFHP31]|nr:hypothetical protein PQX77_014659 [Marasmius sp. AFHP31]